MRWQVLRYEGSSSTPPALVYTHPGYPAYMGVNGAGLAVLWQYIDTGERNDAGVPTCVMLRELLAQTSLDAAVALLHAAPLTVSELKPSVCLAYAEMCRVYAEHMPK